jgi:hypothetical protein
VGLPDLAAWLSTSLYPLTAVAGVVLRRFVSGGFIARLRPHFYLGYAVLGTAAMHTAFAAGNANAIGSSDLTIAVFALLGLGFQTFVGLSLQAPGAYRPVLRGFHLIATWSVGILILAHVVLTI